jgi:hypothetical protein
MYFMKQLFPRNLVILFAKLLMSGHGIVDLRGKVQGSVTQKGRYGMVMRVKVTPVNPRSSAQQYIRSLFAYFSANFRNLGATAIAGFNAAAANGFVITNVFGNSVKQTGHGLYVGLNMNLSVAGQSPLIIAPTPAGVPSPLGIAPASVAGVSLFINAEFFGGVDVVPASTTLVYMGTPKLSDGQTSVKGKYRILGTIAAAGDTGTTNVQATYEAMFGAVTAGDRFGIQVVTVNNNTGEAGVPTSAIITAT